MTSRLQVFARQVRRNRLLFLMALAILVWYAVFRYAPYWWNVIAFKDFQWGLGFWKSPWIGLGNFRALFKDPEFLKVLRNTVVISGMKLLVSFPFPILLAILLNEVFSAAFRKTVQTITFIPFFISWVIYASILASILSPTTGMLNFLLEALGGKSIYFLQVGNPYWFRMADDGSAKTQLGGAVQSGIASFVSKETHGGSLVFLQGVWDNTIQLPDGSSCLGIYLSRLDGQGGYVLLAVTVFVFALILGGA